MAGYDAPAGERLAGKVTIVAGASSGMGRATAILFGREGASVVLVGRQRAALEQAAEQIRDAGGKAVPVVCDLGDAAATEATFDTVAREVGPIDVVVHTAGTNIKERALPVLTQESWDEMIRANLTTAYNVTQAAIPRLRGRGGRIIYVSSLAVQRPDVSGVAYQATKHAVVGLAHGAMQEEKANGIRATVIFPGLTETPLLLKRPTPTPPEVVAKALQPEDVALACLFVATLPSRANVPELQLAPAELW